MERLRREGEEGRRRSSSQEAHFRTTEQVVLVFEFVLVFVFVFVSQ